MKIILIFIFLILNTAYGYEVRHLINSNTSMFSISLGNVCSTLTDSSVGKKNQPALIPTTDETFFTINGIGKAKGNSIDNGRKLLLDKIEKDFLISLFSKTRFNSFTFNSDLEFYNSYFIFSYSPYYLLADILITNPAFPEMALLLMKRSTIKVASGYELSKHFGKISEDVKVSIGGNLYHYTDKFYKGSISLLDLTLNRFYDIVHFQERRYLDLDLGVVVDPKGFWYLPTISLLAKNINSPYKFTSLDYARTNTLAPKNLFERRSEISLGYNIKTFLGGLYLGTTLPFRDLYKEFYEDHTALAGGFNFGLFSLTTSYSAYSNTFGMVAKGNEFSISVNFTREKEINNNFIKEEDSVYVGLELLYK